MWVLGVGAGDVSKLVQSEYRLITSRNFEQRYTMYNGTMLQCARVQCTMVQWYNINHDHPPKQALTISDALVLHILHHNLLTLHLDHANANRVVTL